VNILFKTGLIFSEENDDEITTENGVEIVSIRVLRRKPTTFPVTRGRFLLTGASCILAAAFLFRLFSQSRFVTGIETRLLLAGQNPSFVAAILQFELGGRPEKQGEWLRAITTESAVAAALSPREPVAETLLPNTTPDAPAPFFSNQGFAPPSFDLAIPSTPTPTPLPEGIMEITFDPTGSSGYDEAQGVYVKNETSLKIDVAALLEQQSPVSGNPQILIIHTHGSEAFRPDEAYPYIPTDVERTEDIQFNVVRLGDEMRKVFEAQGFRVVHDKTIYDQPSYKGSYGRSLAATEKIIADNPDISVVIDLHRDSIQTADGKIYKTSTQVGGQTAAQLMLVIGTNDSGLNHPNWKKNLTLALHLQKQLNRAYPGLMRPINLRKERFNGHATTGSLLLEVGSSGNTLGEAIVSAKAFAEIMGEFFIQ